jgi:DNA-3-methyladenine glycosylase II
MAFTVGVANDRDRDAVAGAVKCTFLATTNDFERLLEVDPVIRDLNDRFPGVRPVRRQDLLAALVSLISAQQVNLTWAATTRSRLARRFGTNYSIDGYEVYALDAEVLAQATVEQLRELQFTTRKSETITSVAREIAAGRLSLDGLEAMEDARVIERLTEMKGIGLWSAEWILSRALGRPRVVAGDLGVRRVVGRAYLEGRLPGEQDVRELTHHWGESATIAQELVLYGFQGWK